VSTNSYPPEASYQLWLANAHHLYPPPNGGFDLKMETKHLTMHFPKHSLATPLSLVVRYALDTMADLFLNVLISLKDATRRPIWDIWFWPLFRDFSQNTAVHHAFFFEIG
jgi:hypothetical protein